MNAPWLFLPAVVERTRVLLPFSAVQATSARMTFMATLVVPSALRVRSVSHRFGLVVVTMTKGLEEAVRAAISRIAKSWTSLETG